MLATDKGIQGGRRGPRPCGNLHKSGEVGAQRPIRGRMKPDQKKTSVMGCEGKWAVEVGAGRPLPPTPQQNNGAAAKANLFQLGFLLLSFFPS